MKHITLNVCQGVGDIFWVYQKFAPYYDQIHFRIINLKKSICKKQNRAVDFLKLLPKVASITSVQRTAEDYNFIANHRFCMLEIERAWSARSARDFDYAVNGPLEAGIRIDEIDPAYPIEETVPLRIATAQLPFPSQRYLVLYVSGSIMVPATVKKLRLWSGAQWVKFTELFQAKYHMHLPIVVIGANYDRPVALQVAAALKAKGFRTTALIDTPPPLLLDLLRNARCFLGYQSGLNILADNLDVPQVMLYFPYLKPMLNTWCKRRNLQDGLFNAATFNMRTSAVLDGLKLPF